MFTLIAARQARRVGVLQALLREQGLDGRATVALIETLSALLAADQPGPFARGVHTARTGPAVQAAEFANLSADDATAFRPLG